MNIPLISVLTLLFISISLPGCKERIDPGANYCYSIQQLLDSKNANVACHSKADFEGASLCLSGLVEFDGEQGELPRSFFLLATNNPGRSIEIQMDPDVAIEVMPWIRANRGKAASVKGIVSGFGQHGDPDCRREFVQKLAKVSDFNLENPTPPAPPADTIKLETAVWQLSSIKGNGSGLPLPDSLPVPITIKFATGKIEGYGGCNNYGGSYNASGNQLGVSAIFSTKKFCEGISVLENKYFKLLENSKTFAISGESLDIDCGEMGSLAFRLNWKKRN